MGSLQVTLDPISLILSQFFDPTNSNNTLRLIPDTYFERGVNYDEYAQLRESNLQSKRLKLYDIESVSEMPVLEYSPKVKKSVKFNGGLGGFEEDDRVLVPHELECLRESVKFHGNVGEFEEDDRVSVLPKSESLNKSVKFRGISSKIEENGLVYEIPKSEFSPLVKKSVKFNGISGKLEEDELFSAIRSEHSPLLKKSVKFNKYLGKFEENERVPVIPKPDLLRKSVKFHEVSKKSEENSLKIQGGKQGSSVSRKENRNPTTPERTNLNRIPRLEKSATPPSSISKRGKMYESPSKYNGGNKTVNSGEKQSSMKMMMSRKSYASIEELKGLSICASNGINADFRGGKKCNVLRKSTVFSTKYY